MVKDPDKRLSTEECLNHPWIRKNITCRAGAITKKTMRILKRFSQKTPLQKELFFFIAKITREEEIKQLKEIFNQIDIKSEGMIRMSDIKAAFNSVSININDKDLNAVWKGLDFHNNNYINYTEFLAALISDYSYNDNNKLSAMFSFFTGSVEEKQIITYDILIHKAKSLNLILNEKELKESFDKLKKEGKKITFEEFKQLIDPNIQ